MDRASRANDLYEELHRLFEENVSEREAYNQVKNNERFDTVRLAKVSTIYKRFRRQPKREMLKRKKPPKLKELIRTSGQLAYFRSTLKCDHKKCYCLKFWNGYSLDGRFILRDQLPESPDERIYIWRDFFNNKECHIKISTMNESLFWPLTHDTGFLAEKMDQIDGLSFDKSSVSLIEWDWGEKQMRTVHTFAIEDQQRRGIYHIIVTIDAMDRTRFLLQIWNRGLSITFKVGNVDNNEISLEEDILVEGLNFNCEFSLVGNTLYGLDPWHYVRQNEIYVDITRLDQDGQFSRVILNPIPEQFSIVIGQDRAVGCPAMNRLYMAVQNKETKHYGIIWTDFETQERGFLNFCTKELITCIQYMIDGHFLWIQTIGKISKVVSEVHQMQVTFYRIPLKNPEKLSNLAWFSLVRSKSKLKGVDPYEEAEKYLPYTSEIRFPFEE